MAIIIQSALNGGPNLSQPSYLAGNSGVFNWTTFTPISDWGANLTLQGWYRLNGDSLDIRYYGNFTGVPTLGTAGMPLSLPSPYLVDGTKMQNLALATSFINGWGSMRQQSSTNIAYVVARIREATDRIDWVTANADTSYVDFGTPITPSVPYSLNSGATFIGQVFGLPVTE